MTPRRTLIAGGGIAGLATAIALARRGIATCVLEGRSAFSEAGAGIQIGPNGTRVLAELGVAARLAEQTGVPQSILVHDARSGDVLSVLPLGHWIEQRHGAPYWTAHRADLHAALLATAQACPQISVHMGFDVAAVDQSATGVTAISAAGDKMPGDLLIGADGVGSRVRRLAIADVALKPAGRVAVRTVIPVGAEDDAALRRNVCLWLAPGAHVVHYPVRGGREIAVVLVLQDDTLADGWGAPVDASTVMARLQDAPMRLRSLLHRGIDWRQWTLLSAPRLPTWSAGRVLLLGDATGPFFPFLAQGGVMALEDAAVMAKMIAQSADHGSAFAAFEASRRPRRERMIAAAARNGQIYHLDGVMAAARNLAMRAMPGERIMASYDWLYGHRA